MRSDEGGREQRTPIASLELLLDARLEGRVRAEWHALSAAGLSSLGAHTSPSNRPHITLLVRDAAAALPAAERLAPFVEPLLPLPIELSGLVLFGSGHRRVLARGVVATESLLRLHRDVHALAAEGRDSDRPHTRPGEWTPHLTLARRLRVDTATEALRALDEVPATDEATPFAGEIIGLRHWNAATSTVTDLSAPFPEGGIPPAGPRR